MTMNMDELPAGCEQQLRDELGIDLNGGTDEGDRRFFVHRVYELTLEDIARRLGLDGLSLLGWRFVYRDDHGRFAAADFAVTDGGDHVLQGVDYGEHVDGFVSAYDGLLQHEMVTGNDYTISYLRVRIPASEIMAIWLRGEGHHHEMVVPVVPALGVLEHGTAYSVAAFEDILEHSAREHCVTESMDATA